MAEQDGDAVSEWRVKEIAKQAAQKAADLLLQRLGFDHGPSQRIKPLESSGSLGRSVVKARRAVGTTHDELTPTSACGAA